MVLGAAGVNEWEAQKEINHFSSRQWLEELQKSGFKVDFYEKEGLCFFWCRKKTLFSTKKEKGI